MAKRRLNRQQKWRIKKIQEERTQRATARSEKSELALQEGELGTEQKGLVVAHYGSQADIEGCADNASDNIDKNNNNADNLDNPTQRCHIRANLQSLVTGDEVIWRPGKPTGVVVANLPRRSVLKRPDSFGQIKAVASNIDLIVIVISPQPVPHANLIDRYLVATENIGITPLLLLNKTDLLNAVNEDAMTDLLSVYPTLGYQVCYASTKSQEGLEELKNRIQHQTSVFVGQSGVGKSSLINTLLPDAKLKIGELSAAAGKGRHTTTTARLFHLPEGGRIIDSPGIREFGLWHIEREQLLEAFVEFRPFLGHCKFRDCQHEKEPGCALLDALSTGQISPRRLNSFRQIVAENRGN